MYTVKVGFYDLQDGCKTKDGMVYHYYSPGDEFPRKGKTANEERIASLSSSDNKRGIPLIESIYKSKNTETTTETITQEATTGTKEVEESQKPKTATKRKRTTRTTKKNTKKETT